jgi:hypothetical protein
LIVCASLAGCALQHGRASESPLGIAERAQALDEVIGMRYERLSERPPVDACSVFLALDRDPSFRDRFSPYQRAKLSPAPAEPCPASLAAQRMDVGWYVRQIVRSGRGELRVVAVRVGEGGGQTETYLLHHGYGDPKLWRLREVRISRFSFD